ASEPSFATFARTDLALAATAPNDPGAPPFVGCLATSVATSIRTNRFAVETKPAPAGKVRASNDSYLRTARRTKEGLYDSMPVSFHRRRCTALEAKHSEHSERAK